jgi:hypothetical protein
MNVLGIELRRSAGLGAALITVLVGVVALYGAPGRWSSGWMALAMVLREYLILLWPLALAAGAWQGRRDYRANVGELFATTARSRAQRMLPVLGAMAIMLTVAYLLVTVAGLAWVGTTAGYRPLLNFAVVTGVGVLALIGAAWLGLGIGRMLPSPATAPALGVAGVLLIFPSAFVSPDWLAAAISPIFGTSQHHDYQTIDNRVSGALAIWTAALAATGLVLFIAGGWRARAAALVPVLLGLTVAIGVVPRDPDVLDMPVDPTARELVCTDDTPTVCVSRVHAHVLEALTPLAREALTVLAKLPDTPTVVHEDTYVLGDVGSPPQDGVITVPIRIDKRGGLAHSAAVVPEIVSGLGVEYDGKCRNRDHTVERAAAYWLLGREPQSEVGIIPGLISEDPGLNAEAVRLWQGLRELSDNEALARVAAVRKAILACADATDLLSRSAR